MKNKTKALLATISTVTTLGVGGVLLAPENPENLDNIADVRGFENIKYLESLTIQEQIGHYELLYDHARKNGEPLTILQQTIAELKSQLQ